jgi:EAL domain-containing protein (putative c-di-GMP-specific phosphodiesterase class I)
VSIGIAGAPEDGADPDELLSKADIALYSTKRSGGGKAHRFEQSEQDRIRHREELKNDLSVALERDQLRVVYQPQLNLRSRAIVGMEALLRWDHPVRGLISPMDFIPLAEETGLIEEIGAWVLSEACRSAGTWPEDVAVGVNLSPVQFRSSTLAMRVANEIVRSGIKPRRLKLEVTESVLLEHSAENITMLNQLREIGARISLDDFGTGFSSLGYLRAFAFDEIKIDRSFVNDIGREQRSEAVITAVASLARELEIDVTAGGIETGQQHEWLVRSGLSNGQGYYLGRPMSADDAAQVLGVRRLQKRRIA